MDSLSFLQRPAQPTPYPVYVLHGDEAFLKRQVLALLRAQILGESAESMGLATHAGDKAIFATVVEELQTLPFLSPRRLVVVENADPFVTRFRGQLEKLIARPPTAGVLVLEVKTWPANTKLAKAVPDPATLVCKALTTQQLPNWCVQWADRRYGKQLAPGAARLLVELIGADMGHLDQELAKLSAYVEPAVQIDNRAVDRLVGNSRTENTWKIFDAIGEGRTVEALAILGRLFEQGEEPMRILGAFSMQLRRLAQAARLHSLGQPLAGALQQCGVPPFAVRASEQQLRHLGRSRTDRLYEWLIETDLGLKGGSSLPPRSLLEKLVVRLARKND
jgi:DNA polymerase-3 subunit delta